MTFFSFFSARRGRSGQARFSALAALSLSVLALHCGSSNDLGAGGGDYGSPTEGTPRDEAGLAILTPGAGAADSSVPRHPLCGQEGCLPENPFSCDDVDFGFGGLGGTSGALMDAPGGWGGAGVPENAETGGACRPALAELGCTAEDCEVQNQCELAGVAQAAEPCFEPSDCAPGLTCVGDGPSGVCREYCCAGADSCAGDTFCTESSEVGERGAEVPVCLPVDNCSLSEPFPCPDGQECSCSEGTACLVVRADGATACTAPGSGSSGEPCTGLVSAECGHGHVCSANQGCLTVCSTTESTSGCEAKETCQTPAGFPVDLGVCVGDSDSSAVTR